MEDWRVGGMSGERIYRPVGRWAGGLVGERNSGSQVRRLAARRLGGQRSRLAGRRVGGLCVVQRGQVIDIPPAPSRTLPRMPSLSNDMDDTVSIA